MPISAELCEFVLSRLCTTHFGLHIPLDARSFCRHLFQHPTVPAGVPARRVDAPVAARTREERNQWELEYSVDTSSGNFDPRAATDPRMRRMKHKSSEVPLKTVNAIGVLSDDGLHLTPLHSLQIIRPDMGYLDVPDTKESAPASGAAETLQVCFDVRIVPACAVRC
jgi:hypothetical protein